MEKKLDFHPIILFLLNSWAIPPISAIFTFTIIIKKPHKHPRVGSKMICFRTCLRYKKGVGVCSSAHPGYTGLRIAQLTQDRQRQLAHARTNYISIKVYRNAPRRRLVVICLL